MTAPQIRWPAKSDPARAPIHVRNELAMPASPAVVWDILIKAGDWPAFYGNARDVVVADGGQKLTAGARFVWTTFGVRLQTVVEEFVPFERIAWTARAFGVLAYHAWLIAPTEQGCLVITEETQYGVLARASRALFPTRMEHWHQLWLEGLRDRAAQAHVDPATTASTASP